ncbi:MAG: alginate export family protein [Planctomycetes bacterium]|nr:alginate export family protein [Planctomycetota bacterium]
MAKGYACLIAGICLLATTRAWAQNVNAIANNIQRQLDSEDAQYRQGYFRETPISERLLLDAGGTFRYAYNMIQNSQSQSQYLTTPDLRLFLRAELDGTFRFFGRLRFLYNMWDANGARDLRPDSVEQGWQDPIGEIYWAEFDMAGLARSQSGNVNEDFNLIVKGGRNYIIWGQGLVLSNYMYALKAEMTIGDLGLEGMAALTANGQDTVDWDTSRPGYDSDTARLYSGLKIDWNGIPGHKPYLFGIWQTDNNGGQTNVLGTPAFPIPTTFDYNSGYVGGGSTGSIGPDLVYRTEVAWEFGSTLTDSLDPTSPTLARPQFETPISAFAGLAGLTYLMRDQGDTRFDLSVLAGSGDPNRLDSATTFGGIAPGNTDHSFNSLGYVNTGFTLAPDPANLLCPSAGLSTNLLPSVSWARDLRLGLTGYLFMKIDNQAPINILTRPGGSNLIGGEIDTTLDWRLTSDINFNIRYGIFMPNTTVFFDNQSAIRQFFYVGVTFAF